MGGGGGLNRFYVEKKNLAQCYAVIKKNTKYSVRMEDF